MSRKKENNRISSFGLKVLSLVMALMLWFYVANQGGAATSPNNQQTKLDYYNVPAGLTVEGPDTVSVRVWGNSKDTDDIVAFVDLAGLQQGSYELPVKVKPMQGVMFASVQPDKVKVELKSPAVRSLAVKYELTAGLPDGTELRDVNISPAKCIIKGEQEATGQVAAVYARIDVGGETGIISRECVLSARNAQGQEISSGIQIIPSTVNVYAVVESKKISKDLPVKIKTKGKVADGYELVSVSSDTVTVSALGTAAVLSSLTEIDSLEIDLTDKQESFTQAVTLNAPAGIIIAPEQVNVTITVEPAENEVEE